MSNSTTLLDTISSSQASKEVTANALFDAGSHATLYGRRASTTTGLTWGFYGGYLNISGTLTSISNGTVALTASQTNYVEANPATGAVSKNTSAFTAGYIRLYTIVTGASSVTSYTDWRSLLLSGQRGQAYGVASLDSSGLVPLAQLPPTSLERLVAVADQTARYALTTATVQNGDTVKQNDTGLLYLVKDETNLGNANGYEVYTAGTAASVPLSGVTGLGTGVATALAINVGTAGAPVTNGGALGTPASGTVTNLTGTASININGTVGATTPTTGVFTTAKASTGMAVGGATPGTGGIAFPATAVAVADANTLDDYEEGTWTPTNANGLDGTEWGTYTKIGKLVTCFGYAKNDNAGVTANGWGGLPFTASPSSYSGICGNQTETADVTWTILVNASTTTFSIRRGATIQTLSGTNYVYFTLTFMTAA